MKGMNKFHRNISWRASTNILLILRKFKVLEFDDRNQQMNAMSIKGKLNDERTETVLHWTNHIALRNSVFTSSTEPMKSSAPVKWGTLKPSFHHYAFNVFGYVLRKNMKKKFGLQSLSFQKDPFLHEKSKVGLKFL